MNSALLLVSGGGVARSATAAYTALQRSAALQPGEQWRATARGAP